MDYYNSQPAKAPSNILEKFIKRKKWFAIIIDPQANNRVKKKVLPRFELGLLDSESKVLTITP